MLESSKTLIHTNNPHQRVVFLEFGHSDTKMIEKIYAPLLAEEKHKKVSRVMTDLIEDEKTLIPGIVKSRKKEINMDDELLNIKDVIIQGKSTYTYSDTDIMMDIVTNQPTFLQMIKFEKAKEPEENLEEAS